MRTLYHPNMRDTAIEVDDDRVKAYVAQGWRKTPRPKQKDVAPASEPASDDNTDSLDHSGEDNTEEVS